MKNQKNLPHLQACGSPLRAIIVLLTVVFITSSVTFAAKKLLTFDEAKNFGKGK